tara:strand:+ start:91 stop:408 length:318 start_codon:yes stop_codon:yes gene_type:complete
MSKLEIAKETINKHLASKGVATSSYSLINGLEWDGEYGKGSLLILIHEEAEASAHTNMDGAYNYNGGDYSSWEELAENLSKQDLHLEQCTLWYSAVYRWSHPSVR